jgi:Spy/CpxP family protein refolding chaperone
MTDRMRALAVLVAMFLAGCALGAAGSYYWLSRVDSSTQTLQPQPQPQPPMMRDPGNNRRIAEILQLTPEQDSRFREIMADSRKEIEAIRSEELPKIQSAQAEMNRRISELLTEEQRKKFEDYMNNSRQDRRGGRRNSSGSPPPSSPPSFPPSSRR